MDKNEQGGKRSQKKKWLVGIICLLTLFFIVGFALFRKSGQTDEIRVYGNVDIRQVSLAFNYSERIKKLNVQEGDKVKAEEVLGELDTVALELDIKQAEAQIEAQKQAYLRLKNGSRPEEIAQASEPSSPETVSIFQ